MKKQWKSGTNLRLGALVIGALVLVGGAFATASGEVSGLPGSLFASAAATFSGKPTLIIKRDAQSSKGTLQMGKYQLLAQYKVVAKNVTHWATIQQISGQVVITAPSSSRLTISSPTITYYYCIPSGKTYGYGWTGTGNCQSIKLTLSATPTYFNPVTNVYAYNFSGHVPVYPQASPSWLQVSAVPSYAYTGSVKKTDAKDGKIQIQLLGVYATGDQCKTIHYGYKNKYGYSRCTNYSAIVNIVNNGRILTILRPYGYGYKGMHAPIQPPTTK